MLGLQETGRDGFAEFHGGGSGNAERPVRRKQDCRAGGETESRG